MRANSSDGDLIIYQSLFESAPGLFVAVKPDFVIVAASNAYLQATMTERSTLVGQDILEVVPRNPDNPSSPGVRNLRASLCRVLQDKAPDAMAIQKCDVWRSSPEGGGVEERFWSAVNTPVLDSTGNIIYIIHWIDDVTDAVRLRDAEWQPTDPDGVEHLDRIGNLALGIAHDLSNILTSILMAVHLVKKLTPGESVAPLINTLESNCRRAAEVVGQLPKLVRSSNDSSQEVHLRRLLIEMEKKAEATFPRSVQIRVDVPGNLWVVVGDPVELDQMFFNLCLNVRDAMPLGGVLRISADNRLLDEQHTHLDLKGTGHYVAVEIADTGQGTLPASADRGSEPSVAAGVVGNNSDLGLLTVRTILKNHKGSMDVFLSERGGRKGFKVYLPAVTPAETGVSVPELAEMPLGNSELILVVDDDASVRNGAKETLESCNYRVLTAQDGSEAVSFYSQRSEEIRVVLLDMMMPVMDGFATVRMLEVMNPEVKVIAASGLADSPEYVGMSFRAAGKSVRAFISKPYTTDSLLRTLRDVIGPE